MHLSFLDVCNAVYRIVWPASLSGLDEAVLEGQDACKGLARSSSIFRHTLGELDAALDSLKLRDAWAGNRPSNGVSACSILCRHPLAVLTLTLAWHYMYTNEGMVLM